jgi:chemotaxis protein CheC
MDFDSLTDSQKNDVREVGNIGAGNASAAMSEIIHRKCLIDIPRVASVTRADLGKTFEEWGDLFVVALSVKVVGEVPGQVLIATKRAHAHLIIQYMTKSTVPSSGKDLPFTAQYALRQLGDAMARGFTQSIAQFLSAKAKYAMSEILSDQGRLVFRQASAVMAEGEQHLAIYSDFYDSEKTFDGKYVYILSPAAAQALLEKLQKLVDQVQKEGGFVP